MRILRSFDLAFAAHGRVRDDRHLGSARDDPGTDRNRPFESTFSPSIIAAIILGR